MKRLALVVVLIAVASTVAAHYVGKSFEFHRFEHVIDVRLEQDNTLVVLVDNVEVGKRTNFCTPQ